MVSVRKPSLGHLQTRSPPLFLLGGVLVVGHATIVGLQAFTGMARHRTCSQPRATSSWAGLPAPASSSDADSTELHLEVDAGAAGPHATEAFALLGDDTRLAVLLVLWAEHDPYADADGVPFSRIFERVNCDDPGNLSYHLAKLRGPFVRQRTEREEYELRAPGLKLVLAVIAGAGIGDVRREPAEIDQACPFPAAPATVRYRDGFVVWARTECEGIGPEGADTDGALSSTPFAPAGLADRTEPTADSTP